MDSRSVGLLIVLTGAAIAVLGLVVMTGALSWFGRLPGDIHISGDNTRIYIPITTMLIVSVALSVLSLVLRRFL